MEAGAKSEGGDDGAARDECETCSDHQRVAQLNKSRDDLKNRMDKQSWVRNFLSAGVIGGTVATPVAWIATEEWRVVGFVGALLVIAVGWWTTRGRLRELEADQRQVEYERAVVQSDAASKAETLYLKHQFEVKRYYDQTLRHGDYIFYVGILGLVASLVIIGVAFWLIKLETTDVGVDITVAALAAVGALFSNSFVILYRQMHSATITAVGEFHERLVNDNELHFANLLASQQEPTASAAVRERFGLIIVENHHGEPGTGPVGS